MSNSMYDRDEVSTQGLEIQLSDPSHLFRHASEITKGIKGYSFCLFELLNTNILNGKSIISYVFIILFVFAFLETKGGYLQGKIILPKLIGNDPKDGNNKQNYFLRISLGPADIDPASNPLHIHPLLLYLNTRQNRKKRQSKVYLFVIYYHNSAIKVVISIKVN